MQHRKLHQNHRGSREDLGCEHTRKTTKESQTPENTTTKVRKDGFSVLKGLRHEETILEDLIYRACLTNWPMHCR
jgi:hypothetical protein